MSFIAQVDLSSQPADLSDDGFPSSGHLLFFYDIEGLWLSGEDLGAGYDPEDPRQNHCVLYFPEHIEMVRKDFPEALPKEYRYPEHPLRAIAASDIPPEESAAVRSLDLTAEQRNCYYGIAGDEDGLWSERAILGGYPDQAQGDLMELAAERSDVLDFEKDLSVRQRALTWRQILQVPSTRIDGNYVMSWGDAGCLHFYIRDSDLREARFDRTYLEMQF